MYRLIVLFLMASGVIIADTELTQDKIVDIIRTLTSETSKTWINSGVISATHEEYKAPKIENRNDIQPEVAKAIKKHVKENANKEVLEAVSFNTRYRLNNSYNMVSREIVKVDGEKFYWQIEIESRRDTVQPDSSEKTNQNIQYFLMDWNKLRVFVWDGKKYTKYFRPGNQAIITDTPLNVQGPLTVGRIPWGSGKWSYKELQKCRITGFLNEKNEILLNISNDICSKDLILNASQGYSVKSYEYQSKVSGIKFYYIYGDYKEISNGFVPDTVLIEKYDDQRLITRDLWTDILVEDIALSDEDFVIRYDYDAFIEDYRFGPEPLQYEYMPVMELEDIEIGSQDVYSDKIDYLAQNSGFESNCASASIWLSLKKMGRDISPRIISKALPIVNGQSSLADMMMVINGIQGLNAAAVNASIFDISNLKDSQAILYFPGKNHFVNLLAIDGDKICIADMDSKKFSYKISHSELKNLWNGVTLLVSESETGSIKEFVKLSPKELAAIRGAGTCMACNLPIQQGSETGSCYHSGFICSGSVTTTYARTGCGESSSGSCYMSLKISAARTECQFDINDECTPTGATEILGTVEACG